VNDPNLGAGPQPPPLIWPAGRWCPIRTSNHDGTVSGGCSHRVNT